MTLRRPVVINTQYYGGGAGGTVQRNVLQQPDVSSVQKRIVHILTSRLDLYLVKKLIHALRSYHSILISIKYITRYYMIRK